MPCQVWNTINCRNFNFRWDNLQICRVSEITDMTWFNLATTNIYSLFCEMFPRRSSHLENCDRRIVEFNKSSHRQSRHARQIRIDTQHFSRRLNAGAISNSDWYICQLESGYFDRSHEIENALTRCLHEQYNLMSWFKGWVFQTTLVCGESWPALPCNHISPLLRMTVIETLRHKLQRQANT